MSDLRQKKVVKIKPGDRFNQREDRHKTTFWSDVRTIGADYTYVIPTLNISKTGLLLAVDIEAVPFNDTTLLEVRIDPRQPEVSPGKFGKAIPIAHQKGMDARKESKKNHVFFIGKVVRIGNNPEEDDSRLGKFSSSLALRIVQIDIENQKLWNQIIAEHADIVLPEVA